MVRTTNFKHLIFLMLLILNSLILSSCARKQTPQPPKLTVSQQEARENAHLVFNYLHHGYTDKAQEKLQVALQQAPQDPVVLDTAGYFYEKTGLIKKANQFYKQAVITSPHSGIVKNNYGAFLCRNGFYKESLPYFNQAAHTRNTPITQQAIKNEQYCNLQMQSKLGDSATSAYDTHLRME